MLALIRFEIGVLLRAPSVWLVMLACLGWGIIIPVDNLGVGMQTLPLAAPFRTQYFLGLSSLICPLVLMVGIPLSFHRDAAHQFQAISLRFPWTKRFWPKWGAVLMFLLASLAAVPLGMSLGFFFVLEQPMAWVSWLTASVLPVWIFLGLINALVILSVMVCAYHYWRNGFTPYLSGIALLLLFWFSQALTGMPMLGLTAMVSESRWHLAFGLDPFGLSTFFQATAYWTPFQKTANAFPLTQAMLINRVIWLLAAAGCLAMTLRLVRKPRVVRFPRRAPKSQPALPSVRRQVPLELGEPSSLSQFGSLVHQEGRHLLKSWAFRAAMILWTMLCVLGIFMLKGYFSEAVSPRLPATSVILSYSGEAYFMFGLVLAIIFSASILWRERHTGMAPIIHSLPLANGHLFLSKYVALNLISVSMVLAMIMVGWTYQLWVGYPAIDVGHWLQAFYVFGFPLLVHGTLIFAVQAFAFAKRAHPLTAMAISAAVIMALRILPGMLHVRHPLLQGFAFPKLLRRHSEMRGYAQWGELFNHAALLWGLALIPILMLVWKAWPRPESRSRKWQPIFALSLGVFLALGAWTAIAYRQSVPVSQQTKFQARAAYEKRFEHLAGQPVPQVIHTYNEVDLFPDARRLEVHGQYQVKNTQPEDINELLISARQPLENLSFNIPFQQELVDPILHVWLIRFSQPWRAGEIVAFSYQTTMQSTLFAMDPALGKKGSYFLQSQFEPVLGYYEGWEIRDPKQRAAEGLPPKAFRREDRHTLYGRFVQNKRTFEARFSTSANQWPLTSGDRLAETVERGRRTIHYRSEVPIYPVVGYFSGVYDVKAFEAMGIPISVYTHPGHDQNLATVTKAIRETVRYCQENFGPYPYASLAVVEIPGTFPTGGRASAGVIALNEWGLFMRDPSPGRSIHTVVRRTVHEVVHQWFGEKLVPKIANGERVLNESITKYVEAMIVTQLLGPDQERTMNLANNHRYFSGRSRDPQEAPLVEANEYYLCYGKGAIVFQGLAEYWGEQRLNRVLRSFLEDHRQGMTATMPDLVKRLETEADPEDRQMISDAFRQRISYEFKLVDVSVENQEGETWLILQIHTEAQNRDDQGNVAQQVPDVRLRIGFGNKDPRKSLGNISRWETVHIKSSQGTFRMKLQELPGYIFLDPMARQLEVDRSDNGFILRKSELEK